MLLLLHDAAETIERQVLAVATGCSRAGRRPKDVHVWRTVRSCSSMCRVFGKCFFGMVKAA